MVFLLLSQVFGIFEESFDEIEKFGCGLFGDDASVGGESEGEHFSFRDLVVFDNNLRDYVAYSNDGACRRRDDAYEGIDVISAEVA